MNNQFFQTLITKRARFLNGENPSPSKLSAINAQIESAFAVIESFLGNGSDYLITDNDQRRVLPNLSSAIGQGEKIYKPINKFHSLEQIASMYLNNIGLYSAANKTVEVSSMNVISVYVPTGSTIALYYKTNSNNTAAVSFNATSVTLAASPTVYNWWFYTMPESTNSLTITCAGGVKFKSIVLNTDKSGINPTQVMYTNTAAIGNVAYSIPLSNLSYFGINTPCKWASTSRTGNEGISDYICASKSCDYCIGNKYDSIGTPACISAVSLLSSPLSYTPDSTTFKTIQSPLLTVDVPYAGKYLPFKLFDGVSEGGALPSNSLLLYDIANNTVPVVQNLDFYSASTIRGDIVFVKDQIPGIALNPNRYLLVGSYGIANMLVDVLGIVKGY
jgi:hypothetical protein